MLPFKLPRSCTDRRSLYLYKLLVTTVIPNWLSLISPSDPGVNHRLITTTRPRLIPVICLSLHPVRETLPSLLLQRPALCPQFNPAEKPGNGGEQIDLLGGPHWQCFCCCGQCHALALHAWLGVRCWHRNKRRPGIWSDAVFVDKTRLVFAYSSYLSPKHINPVTQMCRFLGCPCLFFTWL